MICHFVPQTQRLLVLRVQEGLSHTCAGRWSPAFWPPDRPLEQVHLREHWRIRRGQPPGRSWRGRGPGASGSYELAAFREPAPNDELGTANTT